MQSEGHQRRWRSFQLDEKTTLSASLIVPIGTQIVLRKAMTGSLPEAPYQGAVAEIVSCPADAQHAYRVRLVDGSEVSLRRDQFSILKQVKTGPLVDSKAACFCQRNLAPLCR